MARPTKEGLDYFPFDVDIFEDEKIEAIAGEFGIKGELFVVKLLCAIYKKGYFVVWNDLTKSHFLKRVPGSSKELLEQIVNRLVTWEFFDKDLFNSAKVLTSENIQETYFEATKRRKSPKPTKYIINVDINPVSEEVNADINSQSKVKETKVNKTKVNNDYDEWHPAELIQQKWGRFPNGILQGKLAEWLQDWTEEMICIAIESTFEYDVELNGIAPYMTTILDNWKRSGIDTPEKARADREDFKAKKRISKFNKQPIREEKLPEWAKDGYVPPEPDFSNVPF